MTHLAADLRYAWRTLRQTPVFTIVAILSIALGIGANTAIFTLVDQVLLRLLPVKDPARLVMLRGPSGDRHYGSNYGFGMLSYPMYEDLRDSGTPTPIEIVGIAKDALINDVREEEALYYVFLPSGGGGGSWLVRTRQDPAQMFAAIRAVVREIDPNLPVYATKTIEGMLQQSTRNEHLMARLSAVFGTLATLLATIGLYGVLAYTVTRRTREIGIRMALGALRTHVSWLVLREVLILAVAGMAIALPAAWWLGRFVKSQLYDVAPMDPVTIAWAIGGLATVALLSALAPALRATRINPVRALRQD